MALGTAEVTAWVQGARAGLGDARGRIDAVNVFPVPDADTGTNAWLTIEGGARAVDALDAPGDVPVADVLTALARGAMVAARGNSGVILSQWLAGFAHGATGAGGVGPAGGVAPGRVDARGIALALGSAARAARLALADPQEGTVLTLADEVAQAAADAADAGGDGTAVAAQAAAAGHQALARISASHPVLRRAHVPDAGACALLVVVDALALAAAGATRAPVTDWLPDRHPAPGHAQACDEATAGAAQGGAFEVMLVVRDTAPGPAVGDRLRAALAAVGDSVAVVGADGWWHAHVHTDDPQVAIDACAVGRREQVVVRRLDVLEAPQDAGADDWGLVVVTRSAGLAAWFATAGAVVVVRCPEEPVTAAHVRRAVEDAAAPHVLVVPGDAITPDELATMQDDPGVEVLGADDEARAAVAVLAFVTAGGAPGVHAAALAAGRARVAAIDVAGGPGRGVGARAADVEHAVASLVASPAPRGESLTVVVPGTADDAVVAEVERCAARHGLEPTVLGGSAGRAVLVAVD